MSASDFEPSSDERRRMKSEEWADYYAERDEGLRLYRQRSWDPPDLPGTLAEQLADGIPAIDWIVEDLVPAGIVQVNAQWKSGKTTLALNLVRSLVTGEPFLARFAVNLKPEERVGYLNMELSKGQMLKWWAEMGIPEEAMKRIEPYHARESGFGALDLSNEQAVTWLIDWFRDNGITYVIWDPLSKLYNPGSWGGGDPNAAFNRFWIQLERIRCEAGLRGMFIVHHTGFAEEAADRGRGASAMMDNPDVNIAYRLDVDERGQPNPHGPRYLKAFGRDVEIPEFEVGYSSSDRQLYATGGGKRGDARLQRMAREFYEAVTAAADGKSGDEFPNKTNLYQELGWSLRGSGADMPNRAYRLAIANGWVVVVPGARNAKRHMPGPNRPEEQRLKLVKGEDSVS